MNIFVLSHLSSMNDDVTLKMSKVLFMKIGKHMGLLKGEKWTICQREVQSWVHYLSTHSCQVLRLFV